MSRLRATQQSLQFRRFSFLVSPLCSAVPRSALLCCAPPRSAANFDLSFPVAPAGLQNCSAQYPVSRPLNKICSFADSDSWFPTHVRAEPHNYNMFDFENWKVQTLS